MLLCFHWNIFKVCCCVFEMCFISIYNGCLIMRCSKMTFFNGPGLEVIKLEFILRLKIKCIDWLPADTCPQAANHCALF